MTPPLAIGAGPLLWEVLCCSFGGRFRFLIMNIFCWSFFCFGSSQRAVMAPALGLVELLLQLLERPKVLHAVVCWSVVLTASLAVSDGTRFMVCGWLMLWKCLEALGLATLIGYIVVEGLCA